MEATILDTVLYVWCALEIATAPSCAVQTVWPAGLMWLLITQPLPSVSDQLAVRCWAYGMSCLLAIR